MSSLWEKYRVYSIEYRVKKEKKIQIKQYSSFYLTAPLKIALTGSMRNFILRHKLSVITRYLNMSTVPLSALI